MTSNRILIIDDNESIHKDFIKILTTMNDKDSIDEDEAILFNKNNSLTHKNPLQYTIDSAYQGQDGLALVKKSMEEKQPYSMAFIDMLMPPGWNGIETIKQLWQVDSNLQVVICSAHSEYSWEDISKELGHSDNLLILKKPFEIIEICQLAVALTQKWNLRKQLQYQLNHLQTQVAERTADLEESLSLMKATFESTAEGILVVNQDHQITRYNNLFIKLWNLTDQEIQTQNSLDIFKKMAQQVYDHDAFLKTMNDMSRHNEVINTKEVKMRDEKVIEVYRHPHYLNGEIVGTVCSFRDVTQRKQLEDQLVHQATHDSLTELPNRILLSDRVDRSLSHANRFKMFVGFMLFDLDNFKQINDSYGHSIGDTLLKAVAQRLKANVREVDTVTRLGGDEFVVLLAPQAHPEEFEGIVRKLTNIFNSPFQIDTHSLSVTVSVGISIYPQNGSDYESLLKNADIALYRAKEMGRNTYLYFMPEYNENILRTTELTSSLHQALENNELFLQYQPLVELRTNKIIGFEALLRWQHPTLGLVMPTTVIPIAEKTGHIVKIGEWILRTACLQNKIWNDAFSSNLRIAVNISGHQFQQKNFTDLVANILKETGLPPNCLELELTEGIIMANFTDFIEKMGKLKDLGVHFAIDDFGTGYSSLGYLKYFPFDKVKIDKIFIDEITSDKSDGHIVEAIINLSKKMGLTILAEGVEKKEQAMYLLDHHSDQVQGYYFSKPLNKEDCHELLKKGSTISNLDES